jgi:hypothetical protein
MLVAAMEALRARTLVLLSALLLGALTSCSSNSDNPVVPPNDDHPAPVRMITVVGTPRVKVNFTGFLTENLAGTLDGQFSVVFTDSIGRRTFLGDVRLAGVPMHEEVDGLGQPSRYTLDATEMPPGRAVSDTLVFSVGDGLAISPPFSYVIVPSHMVLPADSAVIHQNVDLTLPFTGIADRVLVTFTDQQGSRVRYNLQVENYSGQTSVFVRGSDLAQLSTGPLSLATNVRDDELFIASDYYLQSFTMQTTQSRGLTLAP